MIWKNSGRSDMIRSAFLKTHSGATWRTGWIQSNWPLENPVREWLGVCFSKLMLFPKRANLHWHIYVHWRCPDKTTPSLRHFKLYRVAQLLWLSWFGVFLCTKRLTFPFLVRPHAWISGLPPVGQHPKTQSDVFLSLHPFPSLSLFPLVPL